MMSINFADELEQRSTGNRSENWKLVVLLMMDRMDIPKCIQRSRYNK